MFPDGGFGSIIDQALAQEPASADALATKVVGLGASHALAGFAAKLGTLAEEVRDASRALDTAVRDQKTAEAEEELAQATLRRRIIWIPVKHSGARFRSVSSPVLPATVAAKKL